ILIIQKNKVISGTLFSIILTADLGSLSSIFFTMCEVDIDYCNKLLPIKTKNMERSFVATPISLLHTFCQILLTKCPGLALTVSKRTPGPATIMSFLGFQTSQINDAKLHTIDYDS